MGDHRMRAVSAGDGDADELPVDNVKRWKEQIVPAYPEAGYTFAAPYFYGALRDDDDVMQHFNLGFLIDMLLAREAARVRAHEADARNRETGA